MLREDKIRVIIINISPITAFKVTRSLINVHENITGSIRLRLIITALSDIYPISMHFAKPNVAMAKHMPNNSDGNITLKEKEIPCTNETQKYAKAATRVYSA